MPRVVKRSASQAAKSGRSRGSAVLPQFVTPQLSQPVGKPPSGLSGCMKLDGYRMAARIDNGRVQLLTRTGLDWTDKYPSAIAALLKLNVRTAYLDGELCGVDEAGLPTFAYTQAATDGELNVQLVYYAFDLLHLYGWDISSLQLIERKALLAPIRRVDLKFSRASAGGRGSGPSAPARGRSLAVGQQFRRRPTTKENHDDVFIFSRSRAKKNICLCRRLFPEFGILVESLDRLF